MLLFRVVHALAYEGMSVLSEARVACVARCVVVTFFLVDLSELRKGSQAARNFPWFFGDGAGRQHAADAFASEEGGRSEQGDAVAGG